MLQEMPVMSSGGGSSGNTYSISNVNGTWYLLKNDEVAYIKVSAYASVINDCSDENLTLTKSANSYSFTLTYNKACTENKLNSNGTITTTSKSAGNSSAFTITSVGFLVVFM